MLPFFWALPWYILVTDVPPMATAFYLGALDAVAWVLLSLAFAALVACNLAFWRHLRRVYASPRRSVWRRG